MVRKIVLLVVVTTLAATAAWAGNSLISPGRSIAVAKSALFIAPAIEWNKMGARPGRNSETWTLDGDTLNDLTFYGGITDGRTLFREVDKRGKPLPRFGATMLLTDIPVLFENSYRIALNTPLMTIGKVEPTKFVGHKGIRFTYAFTRQGEDVARRGEANAVIVSGKLYLIAFEAPTLYYFDSGIAAARQVVDSAVLRPAS